MYAGAMSLLKENKEAKLAVASSYKGQVLKCIDTYNITYYLFPEKAYANISELEVYLKEINKLFNPNITHIHGTEYLHSLAYVNACGNSNTVVSIQGLVSVYANYYLGGISEKEIKKHITIRDLVRRDTLLGQQKKMKRRGLFEIELLQKAKHIIGRTSWDKSHIWGINPKANYHFCNETLRSSFYNHKWEFSSSEKYSIFLSQAHYPIKGLQQVIKALPLILREYPKTKVYIAGNNVINNSLLRKNGFANYLEKLINENGVKDHIQFLGLLSEEEMVEQYLKANVFVCPSSIENSPNSVGEAQLLGTPLVATYTGGTMDMVTDGETGYLYRFEETALLAMRICQLFGSPSFCKEISIKEREVSNLRHNSITNAKGLNSIYKTIIEE
jgi:glycosyltransferase involved in cell wall biosynthesis